MSQFSDIYLTFMFKKQIYSNTGSYMMFHTDLTVLVRDGCYIEWTVCLIKISICGERKQQKQCVYVKFYKCCFYKKLMFGDTISWFWTKVTRKSGNWKWFWSILIIFSEKLDFGRKLPDNRVTKNNIGRFWTFSRKTWFGLKSYPKIG
jgi:hypothetical protein